jgi:NRPS condensation-like uncharacterized protein
MRYRAEAFDIWQYLCQTMHDPLVRGRIDLAGHLDVRALREAVALSQETIPLIGCSFDGTRCRPRWVERGLTAADIVRLVPAGEDAERRILKCLSTRIDLLQGPLLQLFVVRRAEGDTLCVVVSHLICDGAGFKQYLYLLSRLYTGVQNRAPAAVPASHPRGTRPLFADIGAAEKIRIFFSRFRTYSPGHRKNLLTFSRGTGLHHTYMERRTIAGDLFAQMKHFARTRHATVNDILTALFARSLSRQTGAEIISLPVTMDLRKFIPPDWPVGITNLSSNCLCRVTVRPDDALSDTLRQVSEQMRRHKGEKNILKSVMLWLLATHVLPYPLLRRLYKYIIVHPFISFTNLGILDDNMLNFGNTAIQYVYLTGSIKSEPHLQVTVSTYKGACTLGCNLYGTPDDKQRVADLLDDMCAEAAACSRGCTASKQESLGWAVGAK